jgi:hypothetical protein
MDIVSYGHLIELSFFSKHKWSCGKLQGGILKVIINNIVKSEIKNYHHLLVNMLTNYPRLADPFFF